MSAAIVRHRAMPWTMKAVVAKGLALISSPRGGFEETTREPQPAKNADASCMAPKRNGERGERAAVKSESSNNARERAVVSATCARGG